MSLAGGDHGRGRSAAVEERRGVRVEHDAGQPREGPRNVTTLVPLAMMYSARLPVRGRGRTHGCSPRVGHGRDVAQEMRPLDGRGQVDLGIADRGGCWRGHQQAAVADDLERHPAGPRLRRRAGIVDHGHLPRAVSANTETRELVVLGQRGVQVAAGAERAAERALPSRGGMLLRGAEHLVLVEPLGHRLIGDRVARGGSQGLCGDVPEVEDQAIFVRHRHGPDHDPGEVRHRDRGDRHAGSGRRRHRGVDPPDAVLTVDIEDVPLAIDVGLIGLRNGGAAVASGVSARS